MKYLAILMLIAGMVFVQAQSFELKTDEAGLSEGLSGNGIGVADYDLDGDLDFYLTSYRQYDPDLISTLNHLYRNEGDGTFADVTDEAGVNSFITNEEHGTMGNKFSATWGDYDNDGDPDLFLTHLGPEILYRNEGDGTFTDISESAGIEGNDSDHNSSAVWWDYDHDGDLDLYVSSWFGPNRMYENIGNDMFDDVSAQSALADTGQTWTAMPIDADLDGWIDLYVVNDYGANMFYRNRGDKTFEEMTMEFGLPDLGHGMGVATGDYNRDGQFDIYVTNIAEFYPNPLFTNNGGTFIDMSEELGVNDAGWAWGTEFFDCDHDGDEDLYVVNGMIICPGDNYFFKNLEIESGAASFVDISVESGTNGEREARGMVTFDYDSDGDLDLLVANWHDPVYLYENVSATYNWLKVELEGTESNRNGFGSTLQVLADGEYYWRHHDGVDFLGQSVQPMHVGVGESQIVDEIVVSWPSGQIDVIESVAVNQQILVREGEGLVTSIDDEIVKLDGFTLQGNYPNPFNGTTRVAFTIDSPGEVALNVYTVLGEPVYSAQKNAAIGSGYFQWDAKDVSGRALASGIYVYTVTLGGKQLTGKMLYVR